MERKEKKYMDNEEILSMEDLKGLGAIIGEESYPDIIQLVQTDMSQFQIRLKRDIQIINTIMAN
jgi:hypothetical protein